MQYLHPKDGVYPEKVNKGRQGANVQDRRIGENTNPVKVRCCALAAGSCFCWSRCHGVLSLVEDASPDRDAAAQMHAHGTSA